MLEIHVHCLTVWCTTWCDNLHIAALACRRAWIDDLITSVQSSDGDMGDDYADDS